jgi:hypothetical protein
MTPDLLIVLGWCVAIALACVYIEAVGRDA